MVPEVVVVHATSRMIDERLIKCTSMSNFWIEGVLSEMQEIWHRGIAYGKRTLSKDDKKYFARREAMLAIVKIMECFLKHLKNKNFLCDVITSSDSGHELNKNRGICIAESTLSKLRILHPNIVKGRTNPTKM
jgi:hypothetical protein